MYSTFNGHRYVCPGQNVLFREILPAKALQESNSSLNRERETPPLSSELKPNHAAVTNQNCLCVCVSELVTSKVVLKCIFPLLSEPFMPTDA